MIPPPGLDKAALQQVREQFKQEAVVLRRLHHTHLVRVIDFFEEMGNTYLVMDFVEGESLAQRIQRVGKIPEALVLTWAEQLLDALAYCHNNNIIHRDIKPQNVIIRLDGQAVLVDFGLVKLWNPSDPHTKTIMHGMGTPEYAPPEQYDANFGHTDPRSDIYSLGATLYHALTGDSPPSASIRIADPELFAQVWEGVEGISERTCQAIQKSLELARMQRWPNAGAMAEALGLKITYWAPNAPSETATAQSSSPKSKTQKIDWGVMPLPEVAPRLAHPHARRRFGGWGLAFLLLILIGLGTGGYFSGVFSNAYAAWFTTPTLTPLLASTATLTLTPSPTHTPDATSTSAVATIVAAAMTIGAPTPTSTLTPSPTHMPRATSTPRGMRMSTATPSVTATAKPTMSTPNTAAVTTQPSATPKATSPGAVVTFEQMGTWRRGDQPYGELVQSQEQVRSGSYAAKLTYNFPAVADDFVVFIQSRALGGSPNTFSAWVYGDDSGHYLNLWVQDAQAQIWSVHLGRVGGTGWRQMSGTLVAGQTWPSGHVSGPDNGSIDYPVKFHAMVLDRPDRGPQQGQIYVDDISAWRSDVAVAPTAAPTEQTTMVTPGSSPPPTVAPVTPGEIGRIVFTVKAGATYYLYSTDPNWSQMQEIGVTDENHSTCAGTTAATLSGVVVNLYGTSKCGITGRTDVCTAPDGRYKVITNQVEDNVHSLSVYTADDTEQRFYFQGQLNRTIGIQWTPNSQHAIFGIGATVNIIQAGVDGYRQITGNIDNAWPPQLSPDGSMIYYLQPVGAEGASDVFVVSLDGSNVQNLTNSTIAHKLCPRWRR